MNTVTEMQVTEIKMPDPMLFTESAASKVAQLIKEEGNPDLKLRVFVQGGGCSGFQYGFTFDEVTNEDDTVLNKNGVQLLVDPMSLQYLVGAEIDYPDGVFTEPFRRDIGLDVGDETVFVGLIDEILQYCTHGVAPVKPKRTTRNRR